jgi:hypothetical protein
MENVGSRLIAIRIADRLATPCRWLRPDTIVRLIAIALLVLLFMTTAILLLLNM